MESEALEALSKALSKITKAAGKYHGKPCRECGETLRYRSNKRCVMCKHEMDAWNYQQRKARQDVENRHDLEVA